MRLWREPPPGQPQLTRHWAMPSVLPGWIVSNTSAAIRCMAWFSHSSRLFGRVMLGVVMSVAPSNGEDGEAGPLDGFDLKGQKAQVYAGASAAAVAIFPVDEAGVGGQVAGHG